MIPEITEKYGNRVRVRICGVCWDADNLLVINHKHLTAGDFWAMPGGGLEFGERTEDALMREFREETNLDITPGTFRFACELIKPPLHGIELFFSVTHASGTVKTGHDPETHTRLIDSATYMSIPEILRIPETERHGIFNYIKNAADLKTLTGFYRI